MKQKNPAPKPIFLSTDILIAGSGIAGLSLALRVAEFARVLLVTKKDIMEANTNYAQGGLAAALGPWDSPDEHIKDTLSCGDGLCRESVVKDIMREAPLVVKELEAWGVRFTKDAQGRLDLGLEGGHSQRRIVRADDMTGRELERALVKAVRENPKITVRENTLLLDLILDQDPAAVASARENRCRGARLLSLMDSVSIDVEAKVVVLATGGAGKVYLYTTNPEIATGDGMAVAFRAGCSLENLEFVQFHPTCLHHPRLRNFLISEAVRGEGARLVNLRGHAFMKDYDARGELAPRDSVARAIDAELKKTGDEFVYLDITHKPEAFLRERFPNIFEKLLTIGINMAQKPIPVVPAAHYFCGGVRASVDGATELPSLKAVGEVACTGLHGANRLASNSLLEACVMSRYAADSISQELSEFSPEVSKGSGWAPIQYGQKSLLGLDVNVLIAHNWDEIRRLMINYVGIVRSHDRLDRARRRLMMIASEVEEIARQYAPTQNLAELVNIAVIARLIAESGLCREESRGLHYRLDWPQTNFDLARPTVTSLYHPAKLEQGLTLLIRESKK